MHARTHSLLFFFRIANHSAGQPHRTKSNQRWMKLRTTVQISSAIQKKPPLKREDSFLKRFSTRQIPETQVSAMHSFAWKWHFSEIESSHFIDFFLLIKFGKSAFIWIHTRTCEHDNLKQERKHTRAHTPGTTFHKNAVCHCENYRTFCIFIMCHRRNSCDLFCSWSHRHSKCVSIFDVKIYMYRRATENREIACHPMRAASMAPNKIRWVTSPAVVIFKHLSILRSYRSLRLHPFLLHLPHTFAHNIQS